MNALLPILRGSGPGQPLVVGSGPGQPLGPVKSVAVSGPRYSGGIASRLRARAGGGGAALLQGHLMALGEPQPASAARKLHEWRARTGERYRIGDGQGRYLRRDGQGVTACVREAWFGTRDQMLCALERLPVPAGMRALRVIDSKIPHRSVIRQLWGAE